ncbi:hypothetical protein GE21DRAFT_8326 [Neurospora crassa]|uniref:Uncharacterized protein n=1 Tax=Neurospora crassa (strain ATCC 24698 / 74-OR23-1A / CBS 708.71 / DSM 1257 / FGSC 987) TaxID=367110 RepID=Q7S7K8_NEUCR|nr:hypothetical protein NCU04330 [Neurospora crassa OR74A]EAA31740.1 hypothetical protein NCU04330 [Neurospora crassa OR74A]KHE82076.1 hypothetical protein GE21DRAFT_8326 [Neurospora crassa]|eukprot:XP_960976.1 hypothetical protein NCU04330 [Neurospora crassa OR74A]
MPTGPPRHSTCPRTKSSFDAETVFKLKLQMGLRGNVTEHGFSIMMGKRRITKEAPPQKSPEAPPSEPKIPTTTDMNIDLIWTGLLKSRDGDWFGYGWGWRNAGGH